MSYKRDLAKALLYMADGNLEVDSNSVRTPQLRVGPKILKLSIWLSSIDFLFGFPEVHITQFKEGENIGYYYIQYRPHPWSWEAKLRRRLCNAHRQRIDQERQQEQEDILRAAQGERVTRLRLMTEGVTPDSE